VQLVSIRKAAVIPNNLNSRFVESSKALLRLLMLLCAAFGLSRLCEAFPGELDPAFGNTGKRVVAVGAISMEGTSAALLPTGKYVLAGTCIDRSAIVQVSNLCVVRYLANGSVDTSFAGAGIAMVEIQTNLPVVLAAQSDGKVVVATSCRLSSRWAFCLFRFDAAGVLDTGFGDVGIVRSALRGFEDHVSAIAVDALDRIVVVGYCLRSNVVPNDLCTARYTANGTLDATYGAGTGFRVVENATFEVFPSSLYINNADGSIAVLAQCWRLGEVKSCIWKSTGSGADAVNFGSSGWAVIAPMPSVANDYSASFAQLPSGQWLVLSSCIGPPWTGSYCVARLQSNGDVDTSFGNAGYSRLEVTPYLSSQSAFASNLVVENGGKFIASGTCYTGDVNGTATREFCVVRGLANGTPDTQYGGNGVVHVKHLERPQYLAGTPLLGTDKLMLVGTCAMNDAAATGAACFARLKGGPYNPLTCALNLDANPTIDPATDALLVTRYLLGYRGDALTTGAVGASPTRTNAEIETYLGTLMQSGKLDVDGDGQSLAMTDGLLLIRAMLGLSGTALTNGATNAAHANVRDAQQILTWIESTHGVACLP
jgi:uncharacterized delta-60 repeat protein